MRRAAVLMCGLLASGASAAALPTKAEVRAAAYVGARGGICGDLPCAADPNIAQVRDVKCARSATDEVVCTYLFRAGRGARFERVNDVLYRDLGTGAWYLDDNDEDIDDVRSVTDRTKR